MEFYFFYARPESQYLFPVFTFLERAGYDGNTVGSHLLLSFRQGLQ